MAFVAAALRRMQIPGDSPTGTHTAHALTGKPGIIVPRLGLMGMIKAGYAKDGTQA